MRSIILTLSIIGTSLFGSEIEKIFQKEEFSKKSITNYDFYFNFDFKNMFNYGNPEFGFRYQKNKFGCGMEAGFNAKEYDFFYRKIGANFYYFPNPNLVEGQVFIGIGIEGVFFSKWVLYEDDEGPFFFRHRWASIVPSLFIGKDFFFSDNQRIFGQISFIPGEQLFIDYRGWDWCKCFGFKIGYGF